MCKRVWIGVDLGKSSFSAALAVVGTCPADWASLPVCEFAHDSPGIKAFVQWVQSHAIDEILGVCVEATGRLSWVFVEGLKEQLGPVSIVNPARPHAYAKSIGLRTKTDRVDACVLALYGLATTPVPKALPDSRQRQLRELAHLYERNLRDKIACQNQLREPFESLFAQQRLRDHLQRLKKELAAIQGEMDRIIALDPQLKNDATRMQTIPGVGPKTARLVIARFGNLRTYTRNELVALAGLYPRRHDSGTSVHHRPRLAKAGESRIRANLYMGAITARRNCVPLRQYADQLRDRGLTTMAILGAIMRKLLMLIRAVVVTETDYDPNYHHTVQSKAA